MKRIFSKSITIMLILGLSLIPFSKSIADEVNLEDNKTVAQIKDARKFPDVTLESWYYDSVMNLSYRNYMIGYTDGSFRPDKFISREEAVKVAYSMLIDYNSDKVNGTFPFIDVGGERWSFNAINYTYNNGIIKGKSSNRFFPEDSLTREEAAVIVDRILVHKEIPLMDSGGNLIKFTDEFEISDWSLESVRRLNRNGLIRGYEDKSFRPQNNITRAEFAKMMNKVLFSIEK